MFLRSLSMQSLSFIIECVCFCCCAVIKKQLLNFIDFIVWEK